MDELNQYVGRLNAIRELFGNQPPITFPLSDEDRGFIEQHLDNDWSPENLCCDGELSREEVDQKRWYLTKVEEQLAKA